VSGDTEMAKGNTCAAGCQLWRHTKRLESVFEHDGVPPDSSVYLYYSSHLITFHQSHGLSFFEFVRSCLWAQDEHLDFASGKP